MKAQKNPRIHSGVSALIGRFVIVVVLIVFFG